MGVQEWECGLLNINDCCFYANSYTMDMMIDLYTLRQKSINPASNYQSEDEGYLNYQNLGPGMIIGGYGFEYGITPQNISATQYSWQETILREGLPEELNPMEPKDFVKIRKYHGDWYTR